MTKEDKELLLKDLYARLFSGIIVHHRNTDKDYRLICVFTDGRIGVTTLELGIPLTPTSVNECRPYLRPMSSMTENEKEEILTLFFGKDSRLFYINDSGVVNGKSTDFFGEGINNVLFSPENVSRYTDWLNKHHFDYRGLIPMGLALEATGGMYNK